MVISAVIAGASFAAEAAGVTAAVGAAVVGADAAATVIGATTVGDIVGGAVIGAGAGALKAAATGGNVLEGALAGGVSAGVGGAVSAEVGQSLGAGSTIDLGGYSPPTVDGSTALGAAVSKGAGSFAGGLAGGLVSGQPIGKALEGAAIGGLAGGLGAGIGNYADLGGLGTSALTGVLNYGLNQAFAPSAKGSSASSAAYQPTLAQNVVSPGTSNAPSTSLLGSALNVGGTSGYTPGGTVFGSSDTGSQPSNVWNQATLRDTTVGQG